MGGGDGCGGGGGGDGGCVIWSREKVCGAKVLDFGSRKWN